MMPCAMFQVSTCVATRSGPGLVDSNRRVRNAATTNTDKQYPLRVEILEERVLYKDLSGLPLLNSPC
jgi:hypothetical protein